MMWRGLWGEKECDRNVKRKSMNQQVEEKNTEYKRMKGRKQTDREELGGAC